MQLLQRVLMTTFIPLAISFLSGCGGSVEMPGTDEASQVSAVLTGVNDAAGDESAFQSIFVGGAAPEDRAKYYSAKIELVGTPNISGDQAEVKVKISQGAAETEGGDGPEAEDVSEGEVTWTLQKEGDAWKIKDAPLP